jgi:hypothetical protein
MLNQSPNIGFPQMKRVQQTTSAHCGPAVLEMLLSFIGYDFNQERFVEALGIGNKLSTHGMTVKEMGEAVRRVMPDVEFWYKNDSSLGQLSQIVRAYGFPVGIEWQGVFFEDSDGDDGHYSVVTSIDTVNNLILLADPYGRFAGIDRRFNISEFQYRWWDTNEIIDPGSGRYSIEEDYHMMFIVTPANTLFPISLNMQRG